MRLFSGSFLIVSLFYLLCILFSNWLAMPHWRLSSSDYFGLEERKRGINAKKNVLARGEVQ